MNVKIERIIIAAVVYSTENKEKVGEAMATLFPFEFEIMVSEATGHYGNPLLYLEVEINKKRQIKEFWNNLMDLLGDQKKILLNMLEEKIDDQGVLHIRIDKQKAYLGKVELTEGGDAIVVETKIVTYPARRERIIEAARQLIEKGYR